MSSAEPSRLRAFAPAKINLTLHVTGRRADGYHELDSLVVFADCGDTLEARVADTLSLSVLGPMAAGVPEGPENLVLRAARLMDAEAGAHLTLVKDLPSMAGVGGGSSDAAATLRLLSRLWGREVPVDVVSLGADTPMCLSPRAQRVQGIGEHCAPFDGLPELPAVLVNPRVPVATPAVFSRLETKENPPMPDTLPTLATPRDAAHWLATQRNDLEAPALAVAPVVSEVLEALSDADLARMSGSGATCFGLYPDAEAAAGAAARISAARPDWWVRATTLNGPMPSE
ncbi:4-diphosphocytidyl-2-C-methyl-D-erythritol kinase [Roseivivax marinus]|uniref:4-(cytidine 5'-diphospho)-2-C-methyl-D-erythritol kinase n=1 Tax=Roseivivax marinus TaxID=1379903 RepID=UPI0008C29A22|nr:4-(cytidine 5'-diphospho)-2-C-methyl-D-erythritol kinase [Roseivivax marinus]SEK57113.1 4-diphosphocytidyl-2-C-methyl-D-erythritol kinase [Roseivivax marinus]